MFKQFPAISWATLAGVVTSVLAVWQSANAGGSTNWWLLLLGVVPIITGALTHAQVIPVASVQQILTEARSVSAAIAELADKADVAISARPANGGPTG